MIAEIRVQAFMTELLIQLRNCGLKAPDPRDLPEIVYHNSNSNFPGESMRMAADLALKHFGNQPKIIFVLLPDTGNAPPACSSLA